MWIVTRDINEYEQDGDYFVAAYHDKPSFKALKELLPGETDVNVGKLTRGGGRQAWEYQWYNLIEIEEGKSYEFY